MTKQEYIHYYVHAPKGLGDDPATCVACAHTHPDLQSQIDNLDNRVTKYSWTGVFFMVTAGVLAELVKRKFL
jgi:hypothetical protein